MSWRQEKNTSSKRSKFLFNSVDRPGSPRSGYTVTVMGPANEVITLDQAFGAIVDAVGGAAAAKPKRQSKAAQAAAEAKAVRAAELRTEFEANMAELEA